MLTLVALALAGGCGHSAAWTCAMSSFAHSPAGHSRSGHASSGATSGRAGSAPANGLEITPQCDITGGADHCMQFPVDPKVSTADVVQMAVASITLPPPHPYTNPSPRTWVGLRTFLWIGPGLWRTYAATAHAGGQTVTVSAHPTQVFWDLGESSTTCPGPGTPWTPETGPPEPLGTRSSEATSACGYTYLRSGWYDVSATVSYTVGWTCTGGCDATAGTWGPLPATGRIHLTVAEIQTTSR
jgi:hypothetical protein